jgi:DNA-binding SARP family transcriptional activator
MIPPQLRLLGGLSYQGDPIAVPRKARALLAYIALADRPMQRVELIEVFCAETIDPRRTLRTLLSHINRAVPDILLLSQDLVSLHEGVDVDCRLLETAVKNKAHSEDVINLYRAEFMAGEHLPDCPIYEMWQLGRRAYFRSLMERILLSAGHDRFLKNDFEGTYRHALRLAEIDPYLEAGQVMVIRALAALNQMRDARDYYEQFKGTLADELGLEPSPEMQQIVRELLSRDVADTASYESSDFTTPFERQRLLFDPRRLQFRLGRDAAPEILERVRRWAHETADLSTELFAYYSADAALETEQFVSEQLAAGRPEISRLLIRRILLGDYVNSPLIEQKRMLERVELLLRDSSDERLLGMKQLCQASISYREGNYRAAISAAGRSAAVLDRLEDARFAGRAAVFMGQSLLRTGDNVNAIKTLDRARALLAAAGDMEGQSLAYGETAWAAINLGQIERALSILRDAMRHFDPLNRSPLISRLAYSMAACWNYYYDAPQMAYWGSEAAVLYERLGNRAMANRCQIFILQADRYRRRNSAIQERLMRLLQRSRLYNDTWTAAWSLVLLGLTAFKDGRLEEAERRYEEAYGLRRRTGERQNQVYDLVYMGRLRAALGRLDSALGYTTEAVRQMERASGKFFPWEAWDMHLAHAEVLQQNGRGPEALERMRAGYETLQGFVEQVELPQHRRQIRESENAQHLIRAYESGSIVPFHQRRHGVI